MQNIKELLNLCQNIAGITIKELSNLLNVECPESFINKGCIGLLLEKYLGVTSGNLPIADFPQLGIELKTIPINPNTLTPKESTYICTAPLHNNIISWENSVVKLKLSKVLWIPIESSNYLNIGERRIGQAFLWQPTKQQEEYLANDWENLTEIIQLGRIKMLSANWGRYLQVRPKAANCKNNLINYVTNEGEMLKTVTRGFYLRARFTKEILAAAFNPILLY